jgi:putative FmdB family regulatory protein
VPTYQYSCTECGHFFEIVQSFSEDSLTVCPECEGRLRKVFNAVGVVFKGSGFYRNDSRAAQSSADPAAKTSSSNGSSDSSGGDSGGASKSDTKSTSSSSASEGKSSGSSEAKTA